MKSVPSSRFTRQTTSFILPFFTSRRGDWKMEAWPSSPVPCSPSAAPSGSLFTSSAASSSLVTLASSGLSSATSFSFSSFAGWRSLCKKIKTSVYNHILLSAQYSLREIMGEVVLTVSPQHPKSETFLIFHLLETVGVTAGSITKMLMSLGGSGWLHVITSWNGLRMCICLYASFFPSFGWPNIFSTCYLI